MIPVVLFHLVLPRHLEDLDRLELEVNQFLLDVFHGKIREAADNDLERSRSGDVVCVEFQFSTM